MPRRETQEQLRERFMSRVSIGAPADCWVWAAGRFSAPNNYGAFSMGNKTRKAHRVSWELHFGPVPAGLIVCHRCDNPPCVNPAHLFLGTHKDNAADRNAKGRWRPGVTPTGVRSRNSRGEKNAMAKLTPDSVRAIRKMVASGATHRRMADAFGVTAAAIAAVVTFKTWKHIKESGNE